MAVIPVDEKGNCSGRGSESAQEEPRVFGDLTRAPDVERGRDPSGRHGPSEMDGNTLAQIQ